MTILYRYLRPKYYSFGRNVVKTEAKGGICFRLEAGHLTYSICHPRQQFSKEQARLLADSRAKYSIGFMIPPEQSTLEQICEEVLKLEEEWRTKGLESVSAQDLYLNAELGILRQRVEEIQASHRRADHLNSLDRDTIEALNFKRIYEKSSR